MRRTTLLSIISFVLILAGFSANTFAQTVAINNISDNTPCTGDVISIVCSSSQVMDNDNFYKLEISSVADNFANPVLIGVMETTSDFVMMTGRIPQNVIEGDNYLVRVVSTSPVATSLSESFTIEQNPDIMASSNSPVNAGDSLMLFATSNMGNAFTWEHPDESTTNDQNAVVHSVTDDDSGIYTVQVTDSNGCRSTATVNVEVITYKVTIPALQSSYCQGGAAAFTYQVSRDFNQGNTFKAELSDITGSFANPVEIGHINTHEADMMHIEFPDSIAGGTGYRIRVVSTSPATVSQVSSQFHLRSTPEPYLQESRSLTMCQGETATITAHGGSFYLWSTGSHENAIVVGQTGNYAVTMTDQYGCVGTAMKSVLVHQPNNAYIISVGSTQLCEGESVRLVAYDGTGYTWSNGEHTQSITVGEAGNYNVTVTNTHGCAKAATEVAVTVIPHPEVMVSHTGTVDICTGESVTISLTEGYENYFWSNGNTSPSITVDAEGDFSATVFDDAGCSTTIETVHVEMHNAPSTPEVTYNSGLGELFCSAGQFYQWYKDGVAIDGAVQHHLAVRDENGLQEGTYTAEVSNVYGCGKMSATYELFEVTSGITSKEKRILSLYPNPNNGIFELDIPANAGMHIVVTNSIGSIVYNAENNFERSQIDLTHLKSGVYFLKAYDDAGVSSVMFLKN